MKTKFAGGCMRFTVYFQVAGRKEGRKSTGKRERNNYYDEQNMENKFRIEFAQPIVLNVHVHATR